MALREVSWVSVDLWGGEGIVLEETVAELEVPECGEVLGAGNDGFMLSAGAGAVCRELVLGESCGVIIHVLKSWTCESVRIDCTTECLNEIGIPDGTGREEHRRVRVRSWAMRVSRREDLVTGSTIVALAEVNKIFWTDQRG